MRPLWIWPATAMTVVAASVFNFSGLKRSEPIMRAAAAQPEGKSATLQRFQYEDLIEDQIRVRIRKSVPFESVAWQIAQESSRLPEGVKLVVASPWGERGPADLVAVLSLETYLRGVLPNEMPASWPMEALKAQAVAARTYALSRKRERKGLHYDVDANVMDQVFDWSARRSSEQSRRVDQAVFETRGQILTDRQGRLARTYFHADCGGQTEHAQHVWSGARSLGTAIDGSCPVHARARWQINLTLTEIRERLKARVKDLQRHELRSISVAQRSRSGRVTRLRLRLANGETFELNGNEFREAIGFDQLKSTAFAMERSTEQNKESLMFRGQGHGHGVGMCQWGAQVMAKNGASAEKILRHYFPLAALREPVPSPVAANLPETRSPASPRRF